MSTASSERNMVVVALRLGLDSKSSKPLTEQWDTYMKKYVPFGTIKGFFRLRISISQKKNKKGSSLEIGSL